MADAGTSVDAGNEEQESEHEQLSEAGLGLEGITIPTCCTNAIVHAILSLALVTTSGRPL